MTDRSRLSTACLATQRHNLPAQSPRQLFKPSQAQREAITLPGTQFKKVRLYVRLRTYRRSLPVLGCDEVF